MKRDDAWLLARINTSLATPAGYRAPAVPATVRRINGPAATASDEPAARAPDLVLQGRSELADLRHALVVLDHETWPTPFEAAAAVARLSCVGTIVVTHELPPSVRELLPKALLHLGDIVDPATSVSGAHHEDLSINLRRVAHRHFGHHPFADQSAPTVTVLIDPSSGSAARLEAEFARQQNVTASIVRTLDPEGFVDRGDETAQEGPTYLADTRPDVTYGPHHLEDLVQAIRHSGAEYAFSPDRFEHQPDQGVFLEDAAVPLETALSLGDAPGSGTSLWYRSAGAQRPRLGYAVHGCQSVVLGADPHTCGQRRHGRVRRSLPPQISWVADLVAGPASPAPSYIARATVAARH